MKFFQILIQPLLYIWFSILILFYAFPVALSVLPFSRERRIKITCPIWIIFFRTIVRTIFFAKVTSIDRREEEVQKKVSPSGLYIANHQSFGDIPLVFSKILMPPIMKKQVLYIPILGWCAYASGALVVDRSDKDSRKKVFEISKQELTTNRRQLQYYPEGTRRKDGGIGPKPYEEIKSALMHVAYDYNIPIYPISIYGTPEVINGGLIKPGKKVGRIMHEPVEPHKFANAENFCRAAWQKVIDGYFELEREINS